MSRAGTSGARGTMERDASPARFRWKARRPGRRGLTAGGATAQVLDEGLRGRVGGVEGGEFLGVLERAFDVAALAEIGGERGQGVAVGGALAVGALESRD